MSNLGEELANRGSKLCMQICTNNLSDDVWHKRIVRLSRKHLLDNAIGLGNIRWLSPLATDSFREYELREIALKYPREIALDDMDWSFWSKSRHPQWDAIGITEDNSLVLVEAKANPDEIITACISKNKDGKDKISSTIRTVLGDNEKWITKYYQIANRLTFLQKVQEHFSEKRKVFCVFLYFANDVTLDGTTRKKLSKEEWAKQLESVHKEIEIPQRLIGNVKEIILDIWKDSGIKKETQGV
jgi:hypothetical protein